MTEGRKEGRKEGTVKTDGVNLTREDDTRVKRNKVFLVCVCLLTSRAWLVLWKAHVYVTEAFLVMLCEYDCFPLFPSHDSTTVVLFLFTSCRGHHSKTIKKGRKCVWWINEQPRVEYSLFIDWSTVRYCHCSGLVVELVT